MATITTRSGKGSALTHTELDNNFSNLNSDKVEASGDTITGNLNFQDNAKAQFGTTNDLQIYHDGSNSYINDVGTGNLNINAVNFVVANGSPDYDYIINGLSNDSVKLYHNGNEKIKTTSTGVDVTGTVTADGLTVNSGSTGTTLNFQNSGTAYSTLYNDANGVVIFSADAGNTGAAPRMQLNVGGQQAFRITDGGDVRFYEDTGTTAKFHWDASAESLGIGTIFPVDNLHLFDSTNAGIKFTNTTSGSTASDGFSAGFDNSQTAYFWNYENGGMKFATNNAERVRIDSSGRVGIGTDSPGSNLEVSSATGSASPTATELRIGSSTQASDWSLTDPWATLSFYSADTSGGGAGNLAEISANMENTVGGFASLDFTLQNPGSSYAQTSWLKLNNSASLEGRRVDIEADGGLYVENKVGIGTSSPSATLEVVSSSSGGAPVFSASGTDHVSAIVGTAGGGFSTVTGNYFSIWHQPYADRGTQNNLTERIRIDSSGNLLVGTTTVSLYNSNSEVGSRVGDGVLMVNRSGLTPAYFNRLSNDGAIIDLRKDGTTVGSIGSRGGAGIVLDTGSFDGAIAKQGTNALFWSGVKLYPATDNAFDLGSSTARFKDLYLSGGAYLGGTAAANKLDDYEEGTFTPTITGSSSAGTGTYSDQYGSYTKVGNAVTFTVRVAWSAHTGTGNMLVTGLPFNSSSSTDYRATFPIYHSNISMSASHTMQAIHIANVSSIQLREVDVGGGTDAGLAMDSSGTIVITGVYFTA